VSGPETTLEQLLGEKRMLVCVGSGGVGKTTISAAIALAAARRGRRAIVCTIDPAKRLANSLGIAELGNDVKEVSAEKLAEGGVTLPPGGSLYAMMLDVKRTFDRLIERYAPNAEVAADIQKNHFYQKISSQLAGSQEYMAMEKLYELHHEGRFDLIVLDTPPTKHALDFLRAPKRLTDFLDGSVLKWFVMPYFKAGRFGFNIAGKIAKKAIEWADEMFGMAFLKELNEFFQAFEGLYQGFRERAEKVNDLMRRADLNAFILVTSPTRETVAEARYFDEQLRAFGMPVGGVIANRVHPRFCGMAIEGTRLAASLASEEAANALAADAKARFAARGPLGRAVPKAIQNFYEFEMLAAADRAHLDPLLGATRAAGLFVREVPAFERDVYDVGGLARLDRWLFPGASSGEPHGRRGAIEPGAARGR
jgi:anion-transporting  ArsA/GET3 family ATPase